MIKVNEWVNYVRFDEVPDDGIFVCQPSDAVLDSDCWPIWVIIMANGEITGQHVLYTAPHGGYAITDMHGWTKVQLVEWLQYETYNDPHQQSNNMMWLGSTTEKSDPEPYWFCVDITCAPHMQFVLDVMAYYQVRGYALGNGDTADTMVIDQEMRDGDLQLAEMAFSAPGRLVWYQEKVCPICKDNGETICGHMYFTDAHEAAF